METIIEKLFPIAMVVVIGLYIQHPKTWRVELLKLEYSILKEVRRTDNWGCPSIFNKNACQGYPARSPDISRTYHVP
jgi:hypothetical protein